MEGFAVTDKKTDRLKDLARAVRDCEFARDMAVSHRFAVFRRASMPGEIKFANDGLAMRDGNLLRATRDLLEFIEREFQ